MYEYFIDPDKIQKVSIRALRYLSSQLEMFLLLYEKNILITDRDSLERFNRLKQISEILKQERYDMLINNPELLIDFTDNIEDDYLPDYYPL
jgi:hypothetical protein